jgi:type IV pilus assembly protein PilQ
MKRKVKLFPTLILLTCGALVAAAVPCLSSSHAPATNQPSQANSSAENLTGQSPAPAAAPIPLAHVSRVSVVHSQDGQGTTIRLAADRQPVYHVFQLSNPPRLVVDLMGARNDSGQWKVPADSPYLKDVRLGRFSREDGGTLRIVADLTGNPVFEVHGAANGIQIELVSREAAKNNSKPAVTESAPTPLQTEVVAPPASQPVPAGKKEAAKTAALSGNKATVPALAATTSSYLSALPGTSSPAVAVAAPAAERAGNPNSESVAAQTAANVMAGSTEAAQAANPDQAEAGSDQTPKYTGEPISLNLKNVDLKDFFRLIHEISGLNILVDPDVNGTVTMVLDAVPWDQALDIVLKDNGLGKQLEGNVLRIAKVSTLQAEQEEAKKLAAAKIDNEPLVTVFRPIDYAKATTLAAMLKSWVGGGALSSRGSVLVDDRTNTLIISDIKQRIPIIESIVSKLDTKSAQISIEARIVRVTTDFARDLQSALAFATINSTGHLVNSGATGQGVGATTGNVTSTGNGTAGSSITAPVTAASATGFGVYFLTNAAGRYLVNGAIAAAETRDEAKIISRPSVVTQNNVQATVIQGTQIPVQTSINNTISVQFVQASLQLEVTPQVTNDGNVFLTLRITNNSPGAVLTTVAPSINTQSATTEVLVPDGGTVVFGGVTVTQRTKSVTQVPLLGSIPVLGHLFKNSSTTSNDQELLFFVTPKILKG